MSWKIGGVFGRSPLGPVHEHMAKVQACVDMLPGLMAAFVAGNLGEARRLAAEVHRLEHEADQIKNGIRIRLTTSMFSAAERGEIMMLLRSQDNVADRTDDAAGLMELRRTPVPEALCPALMELAASVRSAAERVTKVEALLDEPDEAPEGEPVKEARAELEQFTQAAHEIDVASRVARARLFELEQSLDPVSVIFLMEVISLVGRVADSAENATDVLMRLVARK